MIEANLKHFPFAPAEIACFIASPKVWLLPCQRRQQRAQQPNQRSEAKPAGRCLGRGQLRQLGHLGQPINPWATRLEDVGGDTKKGANVDTVGMGSSGAEVKRHKSFL